MKAQITSFKEQKSKYGDSFLYVFFKDENGKSFRSCIYKNMRNFQKWEKVLKPGMVLDNLKLKIKGLIDADSQFQIIGIRHFKKPDGRSMTQISRPQKVVQTKLF